MEKGKRKGRIRDAREMDKSTEEVKCIEKGDEENKLAGRRMSRTGAETDKKQKIPPEVFVKLSGNTGPLWTQNDCLANMPHTDNGTFLGA